MVWSMKASRLPGGTIMKTLLAERLAVVEGHPWEDEGLEDAWKEELEVLSQVRDVTLP
jgi:hypothetical protein